MTIATKKAPQANRTILDFSELVEACATTRRLATQTEVSEIALGLAVRRYGSVAQIDERVLAAPMATHIRMLYVKTPQGCVLRSDQTQCHEWVQVYPGARGRTTYRIDDAVHGWFANRWLPMSASERKSKSGFEHPHWFHGQSQVYQRGTGMFYPDAGPDFMNLSADDVRSRIERADEAVPQAWRDDALSFLRRVGEAVAPFRDVLLRYDVEGLDKEERREVLRFEAVGQGKSHWQRFGWQCPYGLRIRLKSPCGLSNEIVPDLSVSVMGPNPMFDGSPDVMYAVEMIYPGGMQRYGSNDRHSTGCNFVVTRTAGKVVEAARQWAANRIYIPCE